MFGIELAEMFRKGGVIMWPLLGCSAFALALVIERGWIILSAMGGYQSLLKRIRPLVKSGRIDEARGAAAELGKPVAAVTLAYLRHWNSEPALREDVVASEGARRMEFLERRLNWLATLAQVTPLLGLLGTVLGLMAAFQAIDAKGANVHATDLATGIWAKLINTAFGLAIAIPCLIAYYWLEARVMQIAAHMEWIVTDLNELRALQEKAGSSEKLAEAVR